MADRPAPESIRFGIVGKGNMGREHLLNLNHPDGCHVVAIAEPMLTCEALPATPAKVTLEEGLMSVAVGAAAQPSIMDVEVKTWPRC